MINSRILEIGDQREKMAIFNFFYHFVKDIAKGEMIAHWILGGSNPWRYDM